MLQRCEDAIKSSIALRNTRAAIAIADYLDSQVESKSNSNLLDTIKVEHPTLHSHLDELAKFMARVFVQEAMSVITELPNDEDCLFMKEYMRRSFVLEEKSGIQLSVILRVNGKIVTAAMIKQPGEDVNPQGITVAAQRLEDCLDYADKQAEKLHGFIFDMPELILGASDELFRGSLIDCHGKSNSIYQQLVACAEESIRIHGWRGIYSHSNDKSAARHTSNGWKDIVKIKYCDLPKELARKPIPGHLHVCFKEF